ncbi:hypothetical protein MESS4_660129 [Mesorhizobium sp. STM 4661]|nr:hypothetical protein MESS4_660129 [Mesorhizobium sp. STM 4661]
MRHRRRGKASDCLDQAVELLVQGFEGAVGHFLSFLFRFQGGMAWNLFDSSSFGTCSNLLLEHDLFWKPGFIFRDHALTRLNKPEKQLKCPAAQLHWQLYRLYSGQISRDRLVAAFHHSGVPRCSLHRHTPKASAPLRICSSAFCRLS